MADKSTLKNLAEDRVKIEKQIRNLSTETLEMIIRSRQITLHYAREAIMKNEPEYLTDNYIEAMANSMEEAARMILEERSQHK